jgi:hypothetical protein
MDVRSLKCKNVYFLFNKFLDKYSFWNAPQPRTSSFTWRIILFGRDLLKQGVSCGVGSDGKQVKILGDNWVPNFPLGVLLPTSPIPSSATVHCLIDEDTKT